MYYYAACNMRGDVVALYKGDGGIKAEYKYDAWGKVLSVTDANNIGLLNPIRYRGYYYDAETGFYYLQSRYYDPEIGRFINADGYVSTGQGVIGNNMFVYCNNNPIKYYDFSGTSCRIHEGGRQGPKCPFLNEKCMFHGTSECCAPVKTSSKPKGEKHKTNSLRICTDGATGSYGSNSHQSSTAMSGRLGVNTPADKIPYIVIPLNHPQYDSLIGCMGVVINNSNGNYVYAVVGDGGPSDNGFGEVSLRVAWDLGFSEEEANGACGPEGDFTIVVYPDTRQNWSSDGLYTQIQKVGKKLYP